MVVTLTRGQRIAHERERRKLTRMQLAVLCGCHLRTIDRIEQGECASISMVMIDALVKHLGIPRRELGAAARRGRGA